ncbi:c-type cytochrome [bacterium]|nr:c-type cytochrome [bacterium]
MTDKENKQHKEVSGDYLPDDKILEGEYDGIREADNPLPRWWVNMFIVSIIFALFYVPIAHMFDITPKAELAKDIAQAAKAADAREAALIASGYYDQNPVEAGQKYFKTFCATCHGQYAEGGLCPNLTDDYWIRVPSEEVIIATISNGVPDKGMPTWLPILGERKIKMITAYVMTLWETEPPVEGKKPEGDKYDMTAYRQAAGSDTTQAAKTDTTATL